jgi:hypothetical protein
MFLHSGRREGAKARRADTVSEFGDDDYKGHGDAATMRYPDVYSEDDSREDTELDEIAQRLERLRHIEAMLKERLVPPSEEGRVCPAAVRDGIAVSFSCWRRSFCARWDSCASCSLSHVQCYL